MKAIVPGFSFVLLIGKLLFPGFPDIFWFESSFLGLLVMAWRLMSWDLPDPFLVVGSALSVLSVLPFPG